MILSLHDGFTYDMHAASGAYVVMEEHRLIDIVTEEDWFGWTLTNEAPERRAFPVELVWVE